MSEFDVSAHDEQLQRNLAEALELHRASPDDPWLKLQYTAAKEDMVRFRRFWRTVDEHVGEDHPEFGHAYGRGRRNGERIKTEE